MGEFDELEYLEFHVVGHQVNSTGDADCIAWAGKINELDATNNGTTYTKSKFLFLPTF